MRLLSATRRLMPLPAREALAWADFVARHHGVPVHTVLDWRVSDLEREAAAIIARLARDAARELVRTNKPAPKAGDLYSRAVRRMVAGAMAAKRAREAREQAALEERLFREQESRRQQT
jgi:hypothetical protein